MNISFIEFIKEKFSMQIDIKKFDEKSYFAIYYKLTDVIVSSLYANPICNKKRKYEIVINICKDNKINAISYHEDGKDYIEINQGTILTIHNIVLKMLEDKRMFSGIWKDASLIKRSKFTMPKIKGNKIFMKTGIRDAKRQDLAFEISYWAILFIICHEIGHHMNGHILWLKSNNVMGLKMFDNEKFISEQINRVNWNIESQTIEMDADYFATSCAMQFIYHQKDIKNKLECINLWFSSISILSLLTEDRNSKNIELFDKEYLPDKFRNILIIENAIGVAKTLYGNAINEEDLKKQFIIQYKQCEETYNQIFNIETNKEKVACELSDDVIKYHNEVIKPTWNKIRSELQEYSRMPLGEPYDL